MHDLAQDAAGLEEVAAAIGRTPGWLRRHWARIAEEHGFPRKHPTGPTWPRGAVRAWLQAGGFAPQAAPSVANDNLSWPLDAQDAEGAYMAQLEQAYGVSS